MKHLFETLSARMAESGHDKKFPGAVAVAERAARTYDDVLAARDSVRKDKNLTTAGQQAKIMEHLEKVMPALQKHQRQIAKARADIERRHASMRPKFPKIDPAILIAVATKIASMKPAEQAAILLAESGVDLIHAQAVLELPPILSGVDDLVRSTLEKGLVSKMYGPALANLEDEKEAWHVAEATLSTARDAVQETGEFSSGHAFAAWLEKVAPPSAAEIAAEQREFDDFAREAVMIAAKGLSFESRMKLHDDVLDFSTSEVLGKPWPPVAA